MQESEHNCIVGVQENPVGNPCHQRNQHGDTKQQKRAVYQSHIVLAVGFSRPLHSLVPENHRDSCENHENRRAEYIAVVVLQKRFRFDDYVKHHQSGERMEKNHPENGDASDCINLPVTLTGRVLRDRRNIRRQSCRIVHLFHSYMLCRIINLRLKL